MESLKSKAPCLAGGGADSVKDGPQTMSSGSESNVLFCFFPYTVWGKKASGNGLSASQSGRQAEAGNQPPQCATYDLSLLF